jgi:hypothetical protein
MITFKQFLMERPTTMTSTAALYVFDIDDTLMHTNAQIHVKDKQGTTVQKLSNQEFNNHSLPDEHQYGFDEFADAEKFNKESKPMDAMILNLKRIQNKIALNLTPGSKIIMNTARADFGDKELFLQTFRDQGIDIDQIHVHRAGNIPGNDLPAIKKLVYIRRYLQTGDFGQVHMYDDSRTNLKAFISLKHEFPDIQFYPWFVKADGTMVPFK